MTAQTENKTVWLEPHWYSSLKNGANALLAAEKFQPGNFIVRRRRPGGPGGNRETQSVSHHDGTAQGAVPIKLINLFARFTNEEHLLTYVLSKPEAQRDIYEFVFEDQLQKPRFDIDVDMKARDLDAKQADILFAAIVADLQAVVEQLVKETMSSTTVLPLLDVSSSPAKATAEKITATMTADGEAGCVRKPKLYETGAILYPSHGPAKRSGHYILTKLHHANSIAARNFYDRVMQRVKPEHNVKPPYIDHAVYSTGQNFRCLYCQKYDSGRMKTKPEATTANIADFRESLLTYTAGTTLLPDMQAVQQAQQPKQQIHMINSLDISDQLLQHIAGWVNMSVENLPFTIRSVKDFLITLKRERASWCGRCNRVHDNDNAYVRLRPLPQIANQYGVHFYCFRDDGKNDKFMGIMRPNVPITEDAKIHYVGAHPPQLFVAFDAGKDLAELQKEWNSKAIAPTHGEVTGKKVPWAREESGWKLSNPASVTGPLENASTPIAWSSPSWSL